MRTPDSGHGVHPSTDANTLVFYPIDEGTGTTAKDVVNGRNVSRGGGVTWVSALIGKGVDIATMTAGMTDGVTAAGTDRVALQGAWTCEAWVRPMSASQASIIEYSDPSAVGAAKRVQMSIGVTASLKAFGVGRTQQGMWVIGVAEEPRRLGSYELVYGLMWQ